MFSIPREKTQSPVVGYKTQEGYFLTPRADKKCLKCVDLGCRCEAHNVIVPSRCFYLTSDELNHRSRTCITSKDLYRFTLFFILICIGSKKKQARQTNSSLRVFVLACVHPLPCTACTIDVQFPECSFWNRLHWPLWHDTDNLLSASDYTNFAFNFALSVTCKLMVRQFCRFFYRAETTYTWFKVK